MLKSFAGKAYRISVLLQLEVEMVLEWFLNGETCMLNLKRMRTIGIGMLELINPSTPNQRAKRISTTAVGGAGVPAIQRSNNVDVFFVTR